MIRLILFAFALFCLSFLPAQAQSRDAYTIHGIAVDERAPTVGEAQQKAFAAAKELASRPRLKVMKRRTVNGMNHGRDFQRPSSISPQ